MKNEKVKTEIGDKPLSWIGGQAKKFTLFFLKTIDLLELNIIIIADDKTC